MLRIIVKSNYIKGKTHKEYYVKYIATRDGVEMIQMSHPEKPATKNQKQLVEKLAIDFPSMKQMFEYEDYMQNPNRENASELITTVIDQNAYDVATKENYVNYIAMRPRVEKIGKHGLFSDSDESINLEKLAKEIGEHEGYVWTHIISLKREDALRLGYDNAEGWKNLCRSKRNELAKAMRIDPNDLKWYAAFHNEGHHPHIHMVAYSENPLKGFLTKEGISQVKKMFSNEIFKQDLIQVYQDQTSTRDEIKRYSKDIVEKLLNGINVACIDNEYIFSKLLELKANLQSYHGRIAFAYIPKSAKQIINDILDAIEKEDTVQELYQQWLLYKQNIHQTYSNHEIERLKLFEEKEFKSMKNVILKEVMVAKEIGFCREELYLDESDDNFWNSDPFELDEHSQYFYEQEEQSSVNINTEYNIEWSDEYKKAVQYFYGSNQVEQDIEESKEILLTEVSKNNVLAIELIAKLYELSNLQEDAKQLYCKAITGFENIIEDTNNDFMRFYSHYRLGKLYLYGKGTELNYEKALFHFHESEGNQYAQYSLGNMYQRGLGTNKDEQKAFEYFEKSADKQNPFAQFKLGQYFERGEIIEKNIDHAQLLYEQSYEAFERMVDDKDDDNLLYRLGTMTYTGKGCESNYQQAVEYLEKAINLKNNNAKTYLAKIYLKENEFSKIPDALKWLEESKDSTSFYILGKEYQEGVHVEKDIDRAVHYFRMCQDNMFALYRLSKIYEDMRDMNTSIEYLLKAEALNYDVAQVRLGQICIEGKYQEKDIQKGLEYLYKAESKGNMFAQYMLGKLFLFGKEIPQDKELAINYLSKSALQGNEYAQYLLDHMEDYHMQPLSLLTSRFFHHLGRVFEDTLHINRNNLLGGVEHKLKSKILSKRSAMGHKKDDHTLHF